VIRETIRRLDKVALARVVLTNREHVIALEARDKGLMGMLLRYPYEVRDASEYFDDIQDVKITKDMLDLAKHIVEKNLGTSNLTSSRIITKPHCGNCFRRNKRDCRSLPHRSGRRTTLLT
jgi:non-homologous end joining protein Ku